MKTTGNVLDGLIHEPEQVAYPLFKLLCACVDQNILVFPILYLKLD